MDSLPRKRVDVLDAEMSYVDVGQGDPIVFLHGNPTSSHLWRDIIPELAGLGRCLAPDLVGMGRSSASPTYSYRLADHQRYLDAWFEAMNIGDRLILVVHDWGSALGFDWARRHAEVIEGLAYMEAIVQPLRWDDFGPAADIFRALRSPSGDEFVLGQNGFVERVLPQGMLRAPDDEVMDAYRAPFQTRESRIPTLVWPRQIPIDGEPADVAQVVERYAAWLAASPVPKLLVLANPGALISPGGRAHEFCRTWPNQSEVTVPGRHFPQEDSPDDVGVALRRFVEQLRSQSKVVAHGRGA